MKNFQIIARATIASVDAKVRIAHALAKIDPNNRADSLRRLRVAQLHARELLTLLEIAELELAAQPLAAAGKLGGEEAA